MIVPGGTPSVSPVRVDRYTGIPLAVTFSDQEPGSVDTTTVQGFVAGVGGIGQPTIGAPSRSGTQSAGAPPIRTFVCRGIART
jgi:hypothetical protein